EAAMPVAVWSIVRVSAGPVVAEGSRLGSGVVGVAPAGSGSPKGVASAAGWGGRAGDGSSPYVAPQESGWSLEHMPGPSGSSAPSSLDHNRHRGGNQPDGPNQHSCDQPETTRLTVMSRRHFPLSLRKPRLDGPPPESDSPGTDGDAPRRRTGSRPPGPTPTPALHHSY